MATVKNNYPKLMELRHSGDTIDLLDTDDKDLIAELQKLLNEKGFKAGGIDGIVGPQTLRAFEKAKDYLNLQYPSLLGKTTIDLLLALSPLRQIFFPTDGIGAMTSPFGYRVHPISGRTSFHRGIDIGAARGTPVYAVADGYVGQIVTGCVEGNFRCGGGFGNFIRLTHNTLRAFQESVYAHLDTAVVRNGQAVRAGQQIGTIGSTGSSTGPHLHFELWKGGKAFNPLDVMNVL